MAWPQGQAHTARKRTVNVGHYHSSSQHLGSTYRAGPSPKHLTRSPSFNLHARPQTKGPFWALCYRQGRQGTERAPHLPRSHSLGSRVDTRLQPCLTQSPGPTSSQNYGRCILGDSCVPASAWCSVSNRIPSSPLTCETDTLIIPSSRVGRLRLREGKSFIQGT